MYDSKELARKALKRAEQINKTRRRRKINVVSISAALCVCTISLLVFLNNSGPEAVISEQHPPTRYITEPSVPLARPPNELMRLCIECGDEIEEDSYNILVSEELCGYCYSFEQC
jgi:hypothetical protein